jgi:hypothetical protein
MSCCTEPYCWKTTSVSDFHLLQVHLPRLHSSKCVCTVGCFHFTTQTSPIFVTTGGVSIVNHHGDGWLTAKNNHRKAHKATAMQLSTSRPTNRLLSTHNLLCQEQNAALLWQMTETETQLSENMVQLLLPCTFVCVCMRSCTCEIEIGSVCHPSFSRVWWWREDVREERRQMTLRSPLSSPHHLEPVWDHMQGVAQSLA